MINRRLVRLLTSLVWSFGVFSAAGCSTWSVRQEMDLPPRPAALRQGGAVAVLPLDGGLGAVASARLRDLFRNAPGQRIAPVAEPERVRSLVERVPFEQLVLPPGTQAVVYGEVTDGFKEEKDRGTTCTATDKKGKCTNRVPSSTFFLSERCDVTLRVRVASAGRGFVTDSVTKSESKLSWKEGDWPPSQRAPLCADALAQAIAELAPVLVGERVETELEFHEVDGDAGGTEQAVKDFRSGKLKDAEDAFRAIPDEPGLKPEAKAWSWHNLGTFLWARGDFSGCLQFANKALERLGGESIVRENRTRCKLFEP